MSAAQTGTSCTDGTAFGPASRCRTFDFTTLFENTVLALLPNLVFLAVFAILRLPILLRKRRVRPPPPHTSSFSIIPMTTYVPDKKSLKTLDRPLDPEQLPLKLDWLGICRIALAVIGSVLAAALMGLTQQELLQDESLKAALGGWSFTVAQAIYLVGAITLTIAVWSERLFTRGGSFLIPFFVFSSILFDGARLRTFNMLDIPPAEHSLRDTSFFRIFAASIGIKVLLLASETVNNDSGETAEARATWLNRIGFFWLFPLMQNGIRRALTMEDLPQLGPSYSTEHLSTRLALFWDAAEQSRLKKEGKPTKSLLLAVFRAFPYLAYAPIVSKAAVVAVTLAQPYLINNVIGFIESWALQFPGSPAPQPVALGWSLAGAFILVYTVNAAAQGMFNWITAQNGVTLRGAVVGQLYAKSLRIHLAEAGTLGSAGAVNLMSTDTTRIVEAVGPVHELWSGIIIVAVGLYILYSQIGTLFAVPLVMTFLFMFGGPSLGINLGKWQKEWSEAIDRRLAVTSSMINGMKAIKMAGLEAFFDRKLTALRQTELAKLSKYLITLANVVFVSHIAQCVLITATFAGLAITNQVHPDSAHPFNQRTVFTALSALNVIAFPVILIGQNFAMSFAAYASFKRVENFLLSEEKDASSEPAQGRAVGGDGLSAGTDVGKAASDPVVKMEAATMKWSPEGDAVLTDVSLTLRPGITMVIGPLSSGKSTLLAAVLAEPFITSGSLVTPARSTARKPIAYAAQDCWMQETLSLRANITFHSHEAFDQEWYDTVVSACCLNEDFATFDRGDLRLAKSLSGGQRQRISLARAVYAREADIFVLDDPFCALDGETEALAWDNLFNQASGLLRNKTIILASNALHRLKDVDWVIRLGQGTIQEQGPSTQVKLSEEEIRDLQAAQKATAAAIKKGMKPKMAAPDKGDGEDRAEDSSESEADNDDKLDPKKQGADEDEDGNVIEDVGVGTIKFRNYLFWLECTGPWLYAFMMVCYIFAAAGTWGLQSYLQQWTIRSPESQRANFGPLLGGLFALMFVYAFIESGDIFISIGVLAPKAGVKLHRRLLSAVLAAPLSFFESRSSGQILNRFSQDLSAADSQWTLYMGAFIACLLSVMGSMILMVISAPYLIIIVVVVAVLVYVIRLYYLPNSRQLRRLEMSSKSPLYTLFGDSTTGLAVIRAFGRERTLTKLHIKYTDESQRPHYALEACRRWLLVWTNACAMFVNAGLVLIAVGLRTSRTGSLIGVALAQTINLSLLLTSVILTWCEAEIAGVVFERLYEYSHTPSENTKRLSDKSMSPRSSSSPTCADTEKGSPVNADEKPKGGVEFERVVLSYTPDEGEAVLRDLSFSVAPGEHLGICGRTGSGKSTILLALLRMVERQSGDIRIGGRSIDSYELHDLRRSVAVVGQDPLIVSGASVRENLELEGELAEDRIWQVLRDVQLADFVKALPQGLDTVLDNKVARFSQGRRQLLSIARVVLNPKQVVVLDEITSAIDEETDAIVQRLMRTEFRASTVISIAHRTAAIVDYDRVMVLSSGEILELDSPAALLAKADGAFRALAAHQGVV
ncbi:hypothetical protein OC834_006672 [Tilletia horrida]|nr:hypothetical protein OC834_006672 [Tilletia horrida]